MQLRGFQFYYPTVLILAVTYILYYSFVIGSGGAEDYESFTRYTARLAFIFFLPVFLIGPLSQIVQSDILSSLRPKRRFIGLTFGVAHFVHLIAILLLHQAKGTWFTFDDSAALIIYSLLVVQVATSNNFSVKKFGKGWKVLHWIAMYALFTGFFITYMGRLQEMGGAVYLILFALASAAWLLRIYVFIQQRIGREA